MPVPPSLALLALLALCWTSPAAAESREERALDAIMAEYWDYHLAEDPIAATQAGVADYNDRLPAVTRRDQLRRRETEQRFLRRVRAIDDARLSEAGRIDAALFEWILEDSIGAYDLDLARIPFNTFSGFFMSTLTASHGVRMNRRDDYEDYLARLADVPRFFAENLDNMRSGMEAGFVLPQIVIDGILPTIEAQLKDDPEASSFFAPFETISDRVPAVDRARLRNLARSVIRNAVIPAFAELARFLREEYRARDALAAEALPGGAAFYAFQIKRYTTLPGISADDIHATGLAEVARIRAEMQLIVDELEFAGDLDEFTEILRSDPQFYARSEAQLLKEAAWIAKRIDYVLPGFFGMLPRQSYGVVPVPAEVAPNYTTGAYYGAPPDGRHGGAFWVNTHALDQRPLYELPALTLHEAVPGHHLQNALALEMQNVPLFRRNLYFSAFGEGWALYAEKLGSEMGIYTTPYEDFGRLSYEMWRACRLVIDTGIHSRAWSRQQAMDYLAANTALSQGNVRAEVDRYISWPGQALAYKLGELEILELRRRAEQALGGRFDLRDFHDATLANGAVPLAILGKSIDRYIAAALAAD